MSARATALLREIAEKARLAQALVNRAESKQALKEIRTLAVDVVRAEDPEPIEELQRKHD